MPSFLWARVCSSVFHDFWCSVSFPLSECLNQNKDVVQLILSEHEGRFSEQSPQKCTKFPSRMGRGAVFFLSAFYFCYYDCITARLCSVWKGEGLTLIPLFSNAWESLRTHFRLGACLVLDIFPNSTLGPQCSRDFYYTASTALGKLKVIFSTCVLLLLDRTPVFLSPPKRVDI